jgi:hypothetical protein
MADSNAHPAPPRGGRVAGLPMNSALQDIDLIDRMSSSLEQARAVALAINEQLEHAMLPPRLLEQLAGEIAVVHNQIVDAQASLDDLAARRPRHDTS